MSKEATLNLTNNWKNYENTWAIGKAYTDEGCLNGIQLAQLFDRSPKQDKVQLLNSLSGSFSVVQKTAEEIFIAADRVRSIPVFYSMAQKDLLISDNPYWIKKQYTHCQLDEISVKELLLCGYVSGPNTLYKEIKQLQAGEVVHFGDKISRNRYFLFQFNEVYGYSKRELLKQLDDLLLKSFKRLISYADGRTLVVPLSGGYDSRLIATMLKRLNYEKIITFTFGKVDNHEARISKEIAKNLNLKWIFIPYDNDSCYKWYNSKERKAYDILADNLCSILIDREFPAVWELKKKNLIPTDSIFVPGHLGDFSAGAHLMLDLNLKLNEAKFIQQILRKWYVMWNWQNIKNDTKNKIEKRIENNSMYTKFDLTQDASSAHANFNWQERQSKLIINMVRIYEFFGYDYWLPFFDKKLLNFWLQAPKKWRIRKKLYSQLVVKLYSSEADVNPKDARKRNTDLQKNKDLVSIIKKCIRLIPIYTLERILYQFSKMNLLPRKGERYDTDWEQSYGRMNKELYDQLKPYIVGRSSCATLEKIGYISYTDSHVRKKVLDMLKRLRGH